MRIVIFLALWSLYIVGGLPDGAQRDLEYRVSWWYPRFMGIVSSCVEGLCGWHLLREVLFRSELEVLSAGKAVPLGVVGAFMLIEGLLRLGITMKLRDGALASLPVALVFKALIAWRDRNDEA